MYLCVEMMALHLTKRVDLFMRRDVMCTIENALMGFYCTTQEVL